MIFVNTRNAIPSHGTIGTAGGFLFAFLGALLLLILYRHFVQHRPLTGPGSKRPPA